MKVRELKNNGMLTVTCLLQDISEQKTRTGKSYVVVTFKPKDEAAFQAKMWDQTRESLEKTCPLLTVVTASIKGNEYQGNMGYVCDKLTVDPSEKATDFIEHGSVPGEDMYDYLVNDVLSRFNTKEAAVALALYQKNHDKLIYWPAAMTVHHNYAGGLIQHSGSLVNLCVKTAKVLEERLKDMNDDIKLVEKISSLKADNAGDELIALIPDDMCKAPMSDNLKALAPRKRLSLMLADKIVKTYPSVDANLVYTALVFKDTGCGGNVFGKNAADVMRAESLPHEDNERFRMFLHALMAEDRDGGVYAATAEAYLVSAIDRIAGVLVSYNVPLRVGTLVPAAAVHDIGKLDELDATQLGTAEFSVDGTLFGHTMLGIRAVTKEMTAEGIPVKDLTNFLHCIASHHGKVEYQALEEPKTPEAVILSMMDMLDSRMDMYTRTADDLNPGEKDDTKRKYLKNSVYRPAYAEAVDETDTAEAAI